MFHAPRLILESDLRPELKPVTIAFVVFADADGGSIFPSVARVCWLLGCSRRTVQNGLRQLRALGILEADGSTKGGRARTTHYTFCPARLPQRAGFGKGAIRSTKRAQPTAPDQIRDQIREYSSPTRLTPRGRIPNQVLADAANLRRMVYGRCPHEPRCHDYHACVRQIAAGLQATRP